MSSSTTRPVEAVRPALPGRKRRPFARWRLGVFLVGAILMPGHLAAAAESAVSKEYQVKAAFLYNFTKFVEWPANRFKDANSPIVIGVIGSNPFGAELENIVRDRKVNDRFITIVTLRTADEAQSAHAVFIAAGEENLIGKQIGSLLSSGVLVVGESERFGALGGTVTFTTVGDKVRFEINIGAAERGGLKISAQLQKLAVAVRKKT